jgi:hypothetical protein
MRKLKSICLLFLLNLFVSQLAIAQTSSELKLKAMRFIDYYSAINIIEDNDGFRACYKNSQVTMPNFILQQNAFHETLTLDEYVIKYNNFVYTKGNAPTVLSTVPYAIRIDTLDAQNLKFSIDVQLYLNTFNSDKLKLTDTLDLNFSLDYLIPSGVFKIASISQNASRGKFLIVKAIRKRNILDGFKKATDSTINQLSNYELLINGLVSQTDSNGVVYLRDINLTNKHGINIATANFADFGGQRFGSSRLRRIYAKPKLNNTQAVFFRKSTFFVEGYFGFNYFVGSNAIQSVNSNIEHVNQKINTKGFGLGLFLFNKKKWDMTLSVGLANNSAENASYLKEDIKTINTIDPDGSNYVRINTISDINEFQHLSFNSIFGKWTIGYKFNNKTKLNFSIKSAKKTSGNLTRETSASAQYSGFYKDYFNVTISENGVYDFGKFQLVDSSGLSLNQDISFYGIGIGLEQNITKKVAINFGLEWLKSKNDLLMPDNRLLSIRNDQLESLLMINQIQHYIAYTTFQISLKYKL